MLSGVLMATPGAVSQGLIWGIMALGVYVTYKILDLADLTVDQSICTGASVSAVMILAGFNPYITLLAAFIAGMLAGLVTGFLHTKVKIPAILAGILVQLALYSVNIRIMTRSNLSLLNQPSVLSLSNINHALIVGILFVIGIIAALYWFFGTELGSAVRATGDNEKMVRALGVSTNKMKMLGLVISNGLVALSGALLAQYQGYSDINMGRGAIVIGLASVIIGDVIFGSRGNFAFKLFSIVCGSVIYFFIIAFALQCGLETTDLKLVSATLVALALAVSNFKPVSKKAKNSVKE
ncbi:MAG: ABC transporter permease [Clostridia bacterium]